MILLLCAAFSVEVRGGATVPQDVAAVYLVGNACMGWGKYVALNKVSDSPHRVYDLKMYLKENENGYFRFHTDKNQDNAGTSLKPQTAKKEFGTEGLTSDNKFWHGSGDDNNWVVKTAGAYDLVLDLDAMTLTATYIGPDFTSLGGKLDIYIIGEEFGDWNLSKGTKLDYVGDGTYRYKGHFNANNSSANEFCFSANRTNYDGLNFQPGAESWATTALVADTEQTAPYYENRNRNWKFTADGYYTIDWKLGATPGDTKIIAYDYMASLPTEATASIDGKGPDYYATFSNIYSDMELSVAGGQTIQLYDVTVAGSTLTLKEREGGKVAQGEGVLVKASTPNITVKAISEGLVPAKFGTKTNLVATPGNEKKVEAEGGYKYYRLAYNKKLEKSGIGFYLTNAGDGSILAQPNKAYLKVPTASAGSMKSFVINPKPSHVEGIEISEQDADRTIYDLSGRRVENPAPGFYIQGNQKVIVK